MKDLYEELGLDRRASEEEIRRAYRKLAAKHHPDRNPDSPQAEERFKRINRAHQVLTDPRQRSLYDRYGERGLGQGFAGAASRPPTSNGGQGPGPHLEDLFQGTRIGDFFGDMLGGARRRRPAPERPPEQKAETWIDFVQALQGVEVKLQLPGAQEELTVRIPPGAADGDKLRLAGQGSVQKPGGPPSDVVLTLRVRAHEFLRREGVDLHLDVPLSVSEAYHGGKVLIPTPDGPVSLTVAAGTQGGQQARLRGRGVRRRQQTGDLYVHYCIQLPAERSERVQDAIDKLGSLQPGEDLRRGLNL